MSRIVLATSGSCGDVHPYIAVALGLKELGHAVRLAAPEFYRAKIEGEGLDFFPIRPDFVPMEADPQTVRRAFNPVSGAAFLLRKLILPCVEETYQDLLSAFAEANLVLIHPLLFPAPLVAEKLGLKWMSVVLSPIVFVSASDPPILSPLPWMHGLRRFGPAPHRVLLRILKALTRGWMRPVDEIRRREGLSPVHGHPMHDDMFSPYGTLAWFSSKMGAVQPDWPAHTEITGFPVYDRDEPRSEFAPRRNPAPRKARLAAVESLPRNQAGARGASAASGLEDGLESFLSSGAPPVVFTLGSSAVVDARDFYAQSRAAVERIGCRAVFVVGRNSPLLLDAAQRSDVFVTGYAPFSELFRRAAAVVHQGGIGTTGQALTAGVPMLVVPLGLDQPDNAARAARLGVARVLPRKRYRAAAVAAHLQALLSEPAYAATAALVGTQLKAEDGVWAACAAIERVLHSDRKPLPFPLSSLAQPSTSVALAGLREPPLPAFAGTPARAARSSKAKR
ncbi:MAG TPA: glycosyltransferase [Acidisarcina sp.]